MSGLSIIITEVDEWSINQSNINLSFQAGEKKCKDESSYIVKQISI